MQTIVWRGRLIYGPFSGFHMACCSSSTDYNKHNVESLAACIEALNDARNETTCYALDVSHGSELILPNQLLPRLTNCGRTN